MNFSDSSTRIRFAREIILEYDLYNHSTVYRNRDDRFAKCDELIDPQQPLKRIFDFLNFEDQRQARLVCKKWNSEITSRPKWRVFKSFNERQHYLLRVILHLLMKKAEHAYVPLLHNSKPFSYKVVFFENLERLKDVTVFKIEEEGKESELPKLIQGKMLGSAEIKDFEFREKIEVTRSPFSIIHVHKMSLVHLTQNKELDTIVGFALEVINDKLETKRFIEAKKAT